jgi:hypothetical protein
MDEAAAARRPHRRSHYAEQRAHDLLDRIGSPTSATSLAAWAPESTVKNRVVLVTRKYEYGDTRISSVLVAARPASAIPDGRQSCHRLQPAIFRHPQDGQEVGSAPRQTHS